VLDNERKSFSNAQEGEMAPERAAMPDQITGERRGTETHGQPTVTWTTKGRS
jgi:hypothetical protein